MMDTNLEGSGYGCAYVSDDAMTCAVLRYDEEADEPCECLCHEWRKDDDSELVPNA